LHVPIVDHPIHNQAFGSGTYYRRQRISPGGLKPGKDNHRLQKGCFAQRVPPNDARNLRVEIQIEPRETAKVPDGKITQHQKEEYKEYKELQEFKEVARQLTTPRSGRPIPV
jgi:hypothetical protein